MKPENENLIRRFLVGEMAEQERFEFEGKFIEDADLFEQINVIEGELIEKYVRGWMSPVERTVFEKNFLTTKKRRERVEFSRDLIAQRDKIKTFDAIGEDDTDTSSERSFIAGIGDWFRSPRVAILGAMGILVAILGTWIFLSNFGSNKQEVVRQQSNSQVLETPKPTKTPEPVISPEVLPDDSNEEPDTNTPSFPTPDNSDDKTNKRSAPEKTPIPAKTPEIKRSPPTPVFALIPGLVRSNGKNNILNLPKSAKGATFQLKLAATDYKTYQAQITDADGKVVAQFNNLKALKNSINFFVGSNKLIKGDYLIKLDGKNSADESDSVADFQFRVQ